MVLKQKILEAIRAGEIDLVFRRWKRPGVKAGGQLKTALGVLAIRELNSIEVEQISSEESLRAGYPELKELVETLVGETGTVYRIRVDFVGQDPRLHLRTQTEWNESEWAALVAQLRRWERSAAEDGWTRTVLSLIASQPGVPASQLAARLQWETLSFKRRVRQLKGLGLTESLQVGYRLSPRGEAALARLR